MNSNHVQTFELKKKTEELVLLPINLLHNSHRRVESVDNRHFKTAYSIHESHPARVEIVDN